MKIAVLGLSGSRRKTGLLCALLVVSAVATAAADEKKQQDLANLDLETLLRMDVVVVSASKHEQVSSDAPAAVFVLTHEDIRRSGAVSIPEVLRLVPGVQINRVDNQSWSVSARGFNSRFANKMLVLVDGRSIYRADFGGVVWEEQNVPLEEIERIEVVRGPGGVLWGINAVNGVINIITKRAVDSRGLRLTVGSGELESVHVGVGYGGTLGAHGAYRVYFDQFQRDALDSQVSPWKHRQLGWRYDGVTASGQLIIQGDLSENEFSDYDGPDAGFPADGRSGTVGVTWKGQIRGPGEWELRTHYDWNTREQSGTLDNSVWGAEAQYRLPRSGRQQLTVGAGARYLSDELRLAIPITFAPPEQHSLQTGLYAQDEIFLWADRLRLIFGAKVENFNRTGTALQPTARALWHVNERHTLWTAASRAARAPSRVEMDTESVVPGGPGTVTINRGNKHLDFERLDAYELGWRWRPEKHLSVEATIFQHQYKNLIGSRSVGTPVFDAGPPPQLFLVSEAANLYSSRSRGADLSVEAALTERFRLQGSLSFLDQQLPSLGTLNLPATDPKRAASLSARIDLPHRLALDLTERYVGEPANGSLDSYYNLDARLGWRASKQLELSVRVDNVFDRHYVEQLDDGGFSTVYAQERTVHVRANWRWRP